MNEVIDAPKSEIRVLPQGPAADSPMGMMMSAMSQGATLEQIEKMMELQERWAAGQAKKAYDEAFAAFKAEAVRVIKNKDVTDGPLRGKSYAELHDWVNAVTPALSKHGLSSSWKLTKDEKDWLEVTCYLRHIGGHEESVSMGGPPDAGGAKNAIQARASTKSYLERYTLKAITGLSEQGDDTDGNVNKDLDATLDWIAKAQEAESEEALRATMKAGVKHFQSVRDREGYAQFANAVQSRGAELKHDPEQPQ